MDFVELFAGIGGFRYGLEKASTKIKDTPNCANDAEQRTSSSRHLFRCVYANDNDRYASAIYRYHYGEIREANIRTVDPSTIPKHDLLTAGFPCQSFSIAGKRGGFEDTRGTLFFEICRILRAKGTKYLLLENVKGLLSHDDGYTFQTIIGTLDELGYDCQWQVLNSKDYGVPQNRERVFIIGCLRGQRRLQVFPIGELSGTDDAKQEPDETASVRCLGDIARNQSNMTIIRTLQGGGHSGGHHSGMTLLHTAFPDGARSRDENGKPQLLPIGYRRIRRLTPIECERLQGFPDNWTKYGIDKNSKEIEISDTQRYKRCGNAVTTNVITAIGRQLGLA